MTPTYTIILKEINDLLSKHIPLSIVKGWLRVTPGRPIIIKGEKPSVTHIFDGNCIVVSSPSYTVTTSVDMVNGTIKQALTTGVSESGESTTISERSYQIADPDSIDKAVGFLVKMVRDYVSPYEDKI